MKKLLQIFCMATLCVSHLSHAGQDKAMLDMLVEKGVLTRTEASELSREQARVVFSRESSEWVKLSSRFQLQYAYTDSHMLSNDMDAHSSTTGFLVRRMFLQADAKIKGGFDVRLSVELARDEIKSVLTDTYIAKDFDCEYIKGRLCAGYMKPRFGHEDVMSSFSLYTIESTVATMYWTGDANGRRLGVGNRYAGVFWFGEVPQVKGWKYWTSVTNSYQLSPNNYLIEYNNINNNLAYWFGSSYDIKGEDFLLTLGFYSGYSSTANKKLGEEPFASIYSFNPFYAGNYKNLYFWGEFIVSGVADGKKNASGDWVQANPYGINFCVEYRFDIGDLGKLGTAFSYSWLDTGGRGVSTRDGVRLSKDIGGTYNNAQGFDASLNWYLRGDDLKFQLGFEYVQYSGTPENRHANHVAESLAVRTQLQIKL